MRRRFAGLATEAIPLLELVELMRSCARVRSRIVVMGESRRGERGVCVMMALASSCKVLPLSLLSLVRVGLCMTLKLPADPIHARELRAAASHNDMAGACNDNAMIQSRLAGEDGGEKAT